MKRGLAVATLVAFLFLPRAASAAGDAESLADDALPGVSGLATKVAHAKWAQRADELMANAPLSTKPGAAWAKGDPHWDAARDGMLAKIDSWAAAVVADAETKEIVRRKFATLDAVKAKAMRQALAAAATREYPALCDSIHLAVLFGDEHRDLKIGTPEFSKAYTTWRASLGTAPSEPKMTPELTALLQSDAGTAYETARGFAVDAILTRLDGQIQLEFYDAQQSILASIEAKAKECAKSKHKK
jgi:hypothetical protein